MTDGDTQARPLPLAGVRVLDLTQILAGPYCTMVLGDLGADVIKVERPGTGDGTRNWGPPFAGGEAAYYLQVNRSKRSIALDLKHPGAREVTDRLSATADVVIENFLPGATARFGLDYPAVRERNPGVVYCSIRGYPHDHPQASRPGYDFVMQGEGGIMSMQGEPDGEPIKVAVAISDIVAGLFAGNAILAALVQRASTGEGRELEVSLLDAQVAWLANRAGDWLIGGMAPERLGNAHPSIVPYETFETADGYLNLAVGNDDQFARLCRTAGRDDLADDPRFTTNPLRVETAGADPAAADDDRGRADSALDRRARPGGGARRPRARPAAGVRRHRRSHGRDGLAPDGGRPAAGADAGPARSRPAARRASRRRSWASTPRRS